MSDMYVLDENGKPVPEKDVVQWGRWFEENREKRIVKQTTTKTGYWVSSVFLGIDHSFRGKTPILWETMVFRPNNDKALKTRGGEEDCERSASKAAALTVHRKMVKKYGGE